MGEIYQFDGSLDIPAFLCLLFEPIQSQKHGYVDMKHPKIFLTALSFGTYKAPIV